MKSSTSCLWSNLLTPDVKKFLFAQSVFTSKQTWGDYSTNVIDYDYLPPARLRLRINKIANAIDYDYIESNHDYSRVYICLETTSERKQNPFAWFDVSIFSDNIRYESMQ